LRAALYVVVMTQSSQGPEAGWFGNQAVDPRDKTRMVRDVFDRVAKRYDLMNDMMSAGVHRAWKARFIADLAPRPHEALLDVAAGTGDIATGWRRAGGGKAMLCDINFSMLNEGRDRAIDRGVTSGMSWTVGNAERLPFPDRSFDAYTIAFGLRNVTDIDAALREARRVLKPGGRFMCLEFSRVAVAPLRKLYDAYSDAVIPKLGAIIAKDRESYVYLVESIRKFPSQDLLLKRMETAGLSLGRYHNLSAGIAAIHRAYRV
jgi:demethylmenaquinone methyltransferase/2-methoxy-6-polyprenyl-1,4-benzoquinol methylase